jgi:hypothetical protein
MSLWTQTYARKVDLEAPTPEQIDLDDIMYSLAGQNRYNAHTRPRISVAEHSVRVAVLAYASLRAPASSPLMLTVDAPPRLAVQHALVHDFHEAYAGDIISPVIRLLARDDGGRAYAGLVARLDAAIWTRIGLSASTGGSLGVAAAVRAVDMLALELERTACLGPSPCPPGDGWPIQNPALVEAAREAWANAAGKQSGLAGICGLPNVPMELYGWSPDCAERVLRAAFAHLFPGVV